MSTISKTFSAVQRGFLLVLAIAGATWLEGHSYSQDTMLTPQEKKSLKTVEKLTSMLRARSVDQVVKESKGLFGPEKDAKKSDSQIGYSVWQSLSGREHYYDGKLIRIDEIISKPNSDSDIVLSALQKKFGKPVDGPKHASMKFELSDFGADLDGYTIAKQYHWNTTIDHAPVGGKTLEVPITIEAVEVKGPEKKQKKEKFIVLVISDAQQVEAVIKAIAP